MSDLTLPLGQQIRQSGDVSQACPDNCEGTAEQLSSVIRSACASYEERETSDSLNDFIHEPEEQSALFDSTLYLHILCPVSGMAKTTKAAELAKENKAPSLIADTKAARQSPASAGSDLTKVPRFFEDGNSINEKEDKMNMDLMSNKYHTDADVLRAISSYSNDLNSGLALNTASSQRISTFSQEKVVPQLDFHFDENSVEYWSDEEDNRYPPQMSLSPPPGHSIFRKITTAENKLGKKEEKTKSIPKITKEIKQLENLSTSRHLNKRLAMKTLSPISAKLDQNQHQKVSRLTETISPSVTSLPLNTAGNFSQTAKTSYQNNWNPRAPNQSNISSPSLIRPTLATTRTLRKEKHPNPIDSICLIRGNGMKDDILFDSQRCAIPKRRVSRSQSSNTASTSTMFPEISTISKAQGTSRSISDFRQSSSIFGKFVKKNSFKGAMNERGKGSDTQSQGSQQVSSSSRSKMGESTKKKIRRILSLN